MWNEWRSLGFDSAFRIRRSALQGFTLIELMVVIVIIGIMVTFVTISVGGRGLEDQAQEDARRLYQILLLAQEEAQMKGVELGFRHTAEGYEFLIVGPEGQWQTVDATGPFKPRTIRPPLRLELRVEGRVVPPAMAAGESDEEGDEEEKIEPQFILLSSGETTGFALDLKADALDRIQQIEGDVLGRIELRQVDEKS